MYASWCLCWGHVEVRGQVEGVSSLHSLCWSWGWSCSDQLGSWCPYLWIHLPILFSHFPAVFPFLVSPIACMGCVHGPYSPVVCMWYMHGLPSPVACMGLTLSHYFLAIISSVFQVAYSLLIYDWRFYSFSQQRKFIIELLSWKIFISVIFNLRISTFKIVLHFYCAKHCYQKYLKHGAWIFTLKICLQLLIWIFVSYVQHLYFLKSKWEARFGLHLMLLTLAHFIISFLWTLGVWGHVL